MAEAGFVVITGAGRGLGRALAQGFAEADWRVAGCGRDGRPLEALAAELGPAHDFQPVDVTQSEVGAWAERLIDAAGPPDLLVNNAGVINQPAPLWRVPPEEFRLVVDVNLVGTYNVVRAFLPAMLERRRGVVVNMSSGWGRTTSPEVAPYCASKFGVEGLTRALAQELPEGLGRRSSGLSAGGRLGPARRALSAVARAGAQRPGAHRAELGRPA